MRTGGEWGPSCEVPLSGRAGESERAGNGDARRGIRLGGFVPWGGLRAFVQLGGGSSRSSDRAGVGGCVGLVRRELRWGPCLGLMLPFAAWFLGGPGVPRFACRIGARIVGPLKESSPIGLGIPHCLGRPDLRFSAHEMETRSLRESYATDRTSTTDTHHRTHETVYTPPGKT